MKCPNCKLENPPEAMRCDCGYDFTSGRMPVVAKPPSLPQEIIVKTYKGSESEATAAFQRDAPLMAQHGYYPITQNWAPGEYGCGAFLGALVLCLLCVGLIIFIYMLIVKPPGTLTVTYQLRLAQQAPLPRISGS